MTSPTNQIARPSTLTAAEASAQPQDGAQDPVVVRPWWARITGTSAFWIAVAQLVLIAIFGILSPGHRFLAGANFSAIGLNSSETILLAVGATFVLAAGELDLSIGSNLVLSSVVAAEVIMHLSPTGPGGFGVASASPLVLILAVLAGVAAGGLYGLINGLFVVKLRVNSFIVTLGTLGVGTAVAQIITGGVDINSLPSSLQTSFGDRAVVGIPLPLIVALLVLAVFWAVLRTTRFGLRVLAHGSSRLALNRSGVRRDSLVIWLFVLSGVLAGLAGVIDITRFGGTSLTGHETDNLAAISAVVIGGTSLFGGRATMLGTLIASFLPDLLIAGLVLLNVGSYYQGAAIGLVLIFAVYLDQVRRHE